MLVGISLLVLWFLTPLIVAWQVESTLVEAGFGEVEVETRGFGWREIEVARVTARSRHAELEAEDLIFHYTLWRLVRREARALEVRRLHVSYSAEVWPDQQDLQREFPFLAEERDPDEPPLAERLIVDEGKLSLAIADATASFELSTSIEASRGGQWEGDLRVVGEGVEVSIEFEADTVEGDGRFEVLDGWVSPDEVWRAIGDFRGREGFRGWGLRGDPILVLGEGVWRDGALAWSARSWFLDVTVEAPEFDVSLPSAFVELAGTMEGRGIRRSLDLDGEARLDLRVDDFQDLLHLGVSLEGRGNHWESMVRLDGDAGQAVVSLYADGGRETGFLEVRRAALDLDRIRQLVVAAVGSRILEEWEVEGDPLELAGRTDWAPGRLDWRLEGEIDSGRITGPEMRVTADWVTLEGEGVATWTGAAWDLQVDARGEAEGFTFDDLHLRDMEATWEGPPWDGVVEFEAMRDPQRFLVVGAYSVRWVEDEWEIEGDTDVDLFQKLN